MKKRRKKPEERTAQDLANLAAAQAKRDRKAALRIREARAREAAQ